MDADLALAIALSLQEERERQAQSAQTTEWPPLHELQCCGTSYFSLAELELCPSCNQAVAAHPSPTNDDSTSTSSSPPPLPRESTGSSEAPQPPPKRTRHEANVGTTRSRSLVIKPTVGSFGRYHDRMLLHCGLSDSRGRVFNFDESGCHVDSDWHESISIAVAAPGLSDAQWDAALEQHHKAELTFKSYRPYQQLKNNCYDYVIRFLNGIKFESRENHEKDDIVRRFIQTPMDLFESYFTVLTKLRTGDGRRAGYISLQSLGGGSSQRHTCDVCAQLIALDDTRHRCTVCDEFDVCSACQAKGGEAAAHKRDHPTLAVEERARYTCDGCRSAIKAPHFRCLECADFDLCGECHASKRRVGAHTDGHRTLRL